MNRDGNDCSLERRTHLVSNIEFHNPIKDNFKYVVSPPNYLIFLLYIFFV